MLNTSTASGVYACRICAWTTFVLTIPAVLVLLALPFVAQYALTLLLELIPPFTGLFSAVVAFGRTPD